MYHRSHGKDAVFGTPEWATKIESMKRELGYFEEYTKVTACSGLAPPPTCYCPSHFLVSVLAGEELSGR